MKLDVLTEKLELKLIKPGRQEKSGYYGPYYSVSKDLDGNVFDLVDNIPGLVIGLVDYKEIKHFWKNAVIPFLCEGNIVESKELCLESVSSQETTTENNHYETFCRDYLPGFVCNLYWINNANHSEL